MDNMVSNLVFWILELYYGNLSPIFWLSVPSSYSLYDKK